MKYVIELSAGRYIALCSNFSEFSTSSGYGTVKVIHKHISEFGRVFNWMHFAVCDKLFSQSS